MSNVFIDDIRDPCHVKQAWHKGEWIEFPSHYTWEIVRSYDEFVRFITERGMPAIISFDHDLSFEHYPQGDLKIEPIDYSKFTEKTGYDCAKWLVDYCAEKDLDLPDFYVHSFNPVGRMNIANYLVRYQEV